MQKITALYIRVSTEAQADEGYSIGAQTAKLRAFCEMRGISHYESFIDGGWSGSNLDRPEMGRLIRASNAGEIERVAVYKLDRLSRSQKDTLYLIEDVFLPNGIDFVSINENIDTGSPYGRAMIGILSAFAQLERENIFLRTRMGMVERVRQGYWMGGGKLPFGYDYDRNGGILIPNRDGETVKEMYRLYLAGWSAGAIASLYGFSSDKLVTQILKRRLNTGVIEYKGEVYPGRHEPLVSEETFARTMRLMRERSFQPGTPGKYLLTGLLECGCCGAKMRYQKWGKAGVRLVCYSRDKSKRHLAHDPDCPNRGMMAEQVEEAVIRDLARVSVELPAEVDGSDAAELLTRQRDRQKRKLSRLYSLYAEQDDEALRVTIDEARAALKEIEERCARLEADGQTRENGARLTARLRSVGDGWGSLTDAERQELVRACVSRIVLKNDEISIYYSFELAKDTEKGEAV